VADAIVVALFGGMGGLYVLAATGLYLILTRLGRLEAHMEHSGSCNDRIRKAMRLILRRVRQLSRGQQQNDDLIRTHIAGGK